MKGEGMEDRPEEKLTDIFTVLGHDLKSPLNAVEQYLEIIRTKALGEKIDAYLPVADRSVARLRQMRELITDVVNWARIQAESPGRPRVRLDLSGSLRAILEEYRPEAEVHRIAVSSDIQDSLVLEGTAWEVDLILRHLISNAIRYNKEGGEVSVRMEKDGDRIRVSISDTGIGMTPEEQARIFREFVRIKNEKTREITGTGLGLAIARKLVECYGGTLSVQSEPEKGTTFFVSLPRG